MIENELEEALALLRQVGCTPGEIERLCQLRRESLQRQQRARRGPQRLAFVRWLVKWLQEGTPDLSIPWR